MEITYEQLGALPKTLKVKVTRTIVLEGEVHWVAHTLEKSWLQPNVEQPSGLLYGTATETKRVIEVD
jgi:hypothetical protein